MNADLEFYGRYKDSEFHKGVYIDLMNFKESYRKKMKYRIRSLLVT
ncbi:hypothetical protein [Clostridium beijerinckii]|nr:hypothetical protein [Clostridium beijerinckii]